MKKIISILLVVSLVLVGCGTKKEEDVIKIGVVGEHNEAIEKVAEILKDEIKIEIVEFSDYTVPNQALNDGDIDLNAFQHYAFLDNEVKEKGFDIVSIGDTIFAPLGIYSKKIKSLDELKNGDIVAIPNDLTNGGRALKLLESAKLIEVNKEAGYVPTVQDITKNDLQLDIKEVDASLTPSLLEDASICVINNTYASDANMSIKDAIFTEKANEDNPYINLIAARKADENNEKYKKIVETYQTPEIEKLIEEVFNGSEVRAWK